LSEAITQFREYIRLDRKHRSGGLTPAELERWTRLKRVLGEKFMPGPGDDQPDRRASLRVPTQLRVDFSSVDALRGQLLTNLSRGGLFVSTTHLLEIGTRVTLHVHIESSDEEIEVPAEVVSHNVGPRFQAELRGMGLRFLEMDDNVRRKLEDLYEGALRRAIRGEGHE
jgi:uncharacterized protein (TIGR02266 family)